MDIWSFNPGFSFNYQNQTNQATQQTAQPMAESAPYNNQVQNPSQESAQQQIENRKQEEKQILNTFFKFLFFGPTRELVLNQT